MHPRIIATAAVTLSMIVVVSATPGIAQHTRPASTRQPAAPLHAGDFYLDASHVYTLVGKTGLGHEHGVVGSLSSGKLLLGTTSQAGEMVFDMKSFVADTDAARKYVGLEGTSSESTQQQVTTNMLGPAVLDVEHYPTATFHIDSAARYEKPSKRGLPQYLLKGQFTLQDATRPLEFLVEVEMVKGWQHVRGGFRIRQTDYGIEPFSKAFGAIGVADELTIWGDAWVAPSAGAAP